MELSVTLQENEYLTKEKKQEIDKQIDEIIKNHKNNAFEINRLVFDSVTALTASDSRANELSEQGVLKRFWGELTGENQKLQSEIDRNLSTAQYCSQQILQKLAEQNLMSFELITTVNNKLNSLTVEIEGEINEIYGTLATFFKQTRSDIIKLETRVERLEKNINLLNWVNTIEYQMYNGVEYTQLTDVEKIICLSRDFYEITKGEWSTSDLLLLKTAIADVGLCTKSKINYLEFIKQVCGKKELYMYLVGKDAQDISVDLNYITLFGSLYKADMLMSKERYIVDSISNILGSHGVKEDKIIIVYMILEKYVKQTSGININIEVNIFDFILEVLFNFKQIKEYKYMKQLPSKMKQAEQYFKQYKIKQAYPILEKLSAYGYSTAKYLLALIFQEGYEGINKNIDLACLLAKQGMEAGNCISAIYYALFYADTSEKNDIYLRYKPKLLHLAEAGNLFAQYEMGRCYINETNEERNYKKAIFWFEKSAEQGFFRAFHSLGIRYNNGEVVDQDYKEAFRLIKKSAEKGFYLSQQKIASLYWDGNGVKEDKVEAERWYEKSAEQNDSWSNRMVGYYAQYYEKDYKKSLLYYQKASELGDIAALNDIGVVYENGYGVDQNPSKAVEYYKKSAEQGNEYAQCNLGLMYLCGKGIEKNLDEAKKWFKKSAEQGHQRAIDALNNNF